MLSNTGIDFPLYRNALFYTITASLLNFELYFKYKYFKTEKYANTAFPYFIIFTLI